MFEDVDGIEEMDMYDGIDFLDSEFYSESYGDDDDEYDAIDDDADVMDEMEDAEEPAGVL